MCAEWSGPRNTKAFVAGALRDSPGSPQRHRTTGRSSLRDILSRAGAGGARPSSASAPSSPSQGTYSSDSSNDGFAAAAAATTPKSPAEANALVKAATHYANFMAEAMKMHETGEALSSISSHGGTKRKNPDNNNNDDDEAEAEVKDEPMDTEAEPFFRTRPVPPPRQPQPPPKTPKTHAGASPSPAAASSGRAMAQRGTATGNARRYAPLVPDTARAEAVQQYLESLDPRERPDHKFVDGRPPSDEAQLAGCIRFPDVAAVMSSLQMRYPWTGTPEGLPVYDMFMFNIPRQAFRPNAVCFNDWNTDSALGRAYKTLVEFFVRCVTYRTDISAGDRAALDAAGRGRGRGRGGGGAGGGGPAAGRGRGDPSAQEVQRRAEESMAEAESLVDDLGRFMFTDPLTGNKTSTSKATFVVEQLVKRGSQDTAGWRLICYVHHDKLDVGRNMSAIMSANMARKLSGRQPSPTEKKERRAAEMVLAKHIERQGGPTSPFLSGTPMLMEDIVNADSLALLLRNFYFARQSVTPEEAAAAREARAKAENNPHLHLSLWDTDAVHDLGQRLGGTARTNPVHPAVCFSVWTGTRYNVAGVDPAQTKEANYLNLLGGPLGRLAGSMPSYRYLVPYPAYAAAACIEHAQTRNLPRLPLVNGRIAREVIDAVAEEEIDLRTDDDGKVRTADGTEYASTSAALADMVRHSLCGGTLFSNADSGVSGTADAEERDRRWKEAFAQAQRDDFEAYRREQLRDGITVSTTNMIVRPEIVSGSIFLQMRAGNEALKEQLRAKHAAGELSDAQFRHKMAQVRRGCRARFWEEVQKVRASEPSDKLLVSPAVQSAIRWHAQTDDRDRLKNHETHVLLPDLSLYANDRLQLDESMVRAFRLKEGAASRTLVRMLVSLYNALMFKMGLHHNLIIDGEQAVGKSHMLESLIAMSIPDLIKDISHLSRKAISTDSAAFTDVCIAFQEAPYYVLGMDERGKPGLGDEFLKAILTSGMMNVFRYDHDENGRSVTVNVLKLCQISIIALSNVVVPQKKNPMLDRFEHVIVAPTCKSEFSAMDLSIGGWCSSADQVYMKGLFIAKQRLMQYYVMMVEKAIESGAVDDVDMTIPRAYWRAISNLLEDKYGMSAPTQRRVENLFMLARQMQVRAACHYVWFSEWGERFRRTPEGAAADFDPEALELIDRLLVVEEEVFADAIALSETSLVPVPVLNVLSACRGMTSECTDGRRIYHPFAPGKGTSPEVKKVDMNYYTFPFTTVEAMCEAIQRPMTHRYRWETINNILRELRRKTVTVTNANGDEIVNEDGSVTDANKDDTGRSSVEEGGGLLLPSERATSFRSEIAEDGTKRVKVTIPMVCIDDIPDMPGRKYKRVCIAKAALNLDQRTRALRECIRYVLSHANARPRRIVTSLQHEAFELVNPKTRQVYCQEDQEEVVAAALRRHGYKVKQKVGDRWVGEGFDPRDVIVFNEEMLIETNGTGQYDKFENPPPLDDGVTAFETKFGSTEDDDYYSSISPEELAALDEPDALRAAEAAVEDVEPFSRVLSRLSEQCTKEQPYHFENPEDYDASAPYLAKDEPPRPAAAKNHGSGADEGEWATKTISSSSSSSSSSSAAATKAADEAKEPGKRQRKVRMVLPEPSGGKKRRMPTYRMLGLYWTPVTYPGMFDVINIRPNPNAEPIIMRNALPSNPLALSIASSMSAACPEGADQYAAAFEDREARFVDGDMELKAFRRRCDEIGVEFDPAITPWGIHKMCLDIQRENPEIFGGLKHTERYPTPNRLSHRSRKSTLDRLQQLTRSRATNGEVWMKLKAEDRATVDAMAIRSEPIDPVAMERATKRSVDEVLKYGRYARHRRQHRTGGPPPGSAAPSPAPGPHRVVGAGAKMWSTPSIPNIDFSPPPPPLATPAHRPLERGASSPSVLTTSFTSSLRPVLAGEQANGDDATTARKRKREEKGKEKLGGDGEAEMEAAAAAEMEAEDRAAATEMAYEGLMRAFRHPEEKGVALEAQEASMATEQLQQAAQALDEQIGIVQASIPHAHDEEDRMTREATVVKLAVEKAQLEEAMAAEAAHVAAMEADAAMAMDIAHQQGDGPS